jgi:SAM-dependent methyltransferase
MLPEQSNVDSKTVTSFGDEWSSFDQSGLSSAELSDLFGRYFGGFPWENLPEDPEGFDMGCGSGRWAALVAPRVRRLNCIDPSEEALSVAARALAGHHNVSLFQASANASPLPPASQDFGYSLGVLHHVPDTQAALAACVALLKPGAPFLLYLYYRFDNRPLWFRLAWRLSDVARSGISKMPSRMKRLVTDTIAGLVYWPLARTSRLVERLGFSPASIPLSFYRSASFYTMRTDSRDRFGTPLEKRFTRAEIEAMMKAAGLDDIRFSDAEPFWCATGLRAHP